MRHLHFVQAIDPLLGGGLGTAALGLNTAMQRAGITSKLVATAQVSQSTDTLASYQRSGPSKLFFSWPMSQDAPQLIQQSDAVHAHGLYVYPNALFGYLAKKERKILVIHPHGFFEPWITMRSPRKKGLAQWAFENRNATYAQLWRALTATEADQIKSRGIRAKVIVSPNGIDTTQIDGALSQLCPQEFADSERVILLMSRLHPKKGIELFLAVWSEIAVRYPDWKVLVVGPDEDGHREHLEALVQSRACKRSVEFRTTIAGSAKFKLLARADLFVLPSLSEGFPMSVLEAAACRTPVVLTRQCNFPELAAAGAGWQCEPDIASLKSALEKALGATDSERDERGRLGRQLIESRYDWTVIASQIDEECLSVRI